jgi:hypothetical protein
MLKFDKFMGINNVQPDHRLRSNELRRAEDVDIGLSNEITRRSGYSELSALCHKNLWQADGFMLATCDSDLVKTTGGTQTVLYPSLGVDRVWYCNLPDGRTTFSNGLISGITDGTTTTSWGTPKPASIGALTAVAGSLFAGDYQWAVTYVRLSDGLEGPPEYSNPVAVSSGGVLLTGLPTLAGHSINVYLTGANGGTLYFAGSTLTSSFSFLSENSSLVLPLRTEHMVPMPKGTVTALWRGRVLVADGGTLWASLPQRWEFCDTRRDFKQFSKTITLIQPVDDGVYIGTANELAFLAGTEFDKLVYTPVLAGRVVLGSGVEVRGELIKRGDRVGDGRAMICIADGVLTAGFGGGSIARLTESRYATAATEVFATFRMNGRVPQYIAVPQ